MSRLVVNRAGYVAAALSAVLALAGCAGGEVETPAGLEVEAAPALPGCGTFTEGAVLSADVIRGGCLDADGVIRAGSFFECEDDRVLLGDDELWGFSDSPLVATEAAGDPAYADAVEECRA